MMESNKINRKQTIEFGLVAILVSGVLAYWFDKKSIELVVVALSLITILFPVLFHPFAFLWFGLSRILGTISSAVLLCLIFGLVVTPMGLFRRLLGKDNLRIRQFKKGNHSVFTDRNHQYTAADMADTF